MLLYREQVGFTTPVPADDQHHQQIKTDHHGQGEQQRIAPVRSDSRGTSRGVEAPEAILPVQHWHVSFSISKVRPPDTMSVAAGVSL